MNSAAFLPSGKYPNILVNNLGYRQLAILQNPIFQYTIQFLHDMVKPVAGMTTSLFLVGFTMGALVLAPLCGDFARHSIYIFSMFIFSCFQVGTSTSKNMTLLGIMVKM